MLKITEIKVIEQNPEEFIRILNEPEASDAAPPATPAVGGGSGGAGGPAISRDQVYFNFTVLKIFSIGLKYGGGDFLKIFSVLERMQMKKCQNRLIFLGL